jgi:para-nitrobenzyl esterase
MLALYRDRYPGRSAFLIQAQIFTDEGGRRSAILQAERKSSLGKAPAYMYQWNFASPGFDGKFGAVHGTDARRERALWNRFAAAWVSLAKTGNPNNPHIPNWPSYDGSRRPTMLFDNELSVENDPRSEIRKFWTEMPPLGALRR